MNSGATAERVYDALKRQLMSGSIRPGERLEPAALADALMSSVTPVRDALHRLIGERLVETRSGSGFHLANLNEPDLRDLYAWNAQLLTDALRWWQPGSVHHGLPVLPSERVSATRALFDHFGALSGNRELVAAIETSGDRLGAVRSIEAAVLRLPEDEVSRINAMIDENPATLNGEVRAYHRRRIAAVPALVRALYRTV